MSSQSTVIMKYAYPKIAKAAMTATGKLLLKRRSKFMKITICNLCTGKNRKKLTLFSEYIILAYFEKKI